ncbi:MAG: hypothetical protein PCFJNLEI_02197 [Verrucomicrobiae bacterium]|nr:hypothetical protein [Verrucomicrobiae bacterium]
MNWLGFGGPRLVVAATVEPMQRSRRSATLRSTGFTLVELLAAMVVLALLMSIIFGIFNQASKAWILAESRTENFQGSRAALDIMCRELEGAMVGVRTNANGTQTRVNLVTFENSGAAAIPTGSGTITPTFATGYGNLSVTSPNDAIFFITQAPDSKSSSSDYIDLAECGYFVGFSTATSGNGGIPRGYYGLFRHYARSSATASWDFFGNTANWWSTVQAVKTPFLDNVIRFELRYEYANPDVGVTNGTSIVENWNTTSGGPLSSIVPDPTTQLPRAFHLRLSVIDRRYAARLAVILNNGSLGSNLNNVPYNLDAISNTALQRTLKEGMRTFFRTVYPRGAS